MGRKKTIAKDVDTGQIFDSKDEMYMYWYFQELKDAGYIKGFIYEPKTYELGSGEERKRVVSYEQKKTKVSIKESYPMLLREHNYTPDFGVLWEEKAKDLFYCHHTEVISLTIPFTIFGNMPRSVLEVKPDLRSSKHKGSRPKTAVSMKWLLEKYNIFTEEIFYEEIFFRTFTPKRFLLTDAKKGKRKLNQRRVRTLEDYVKIRKKINEEHYKLKEKYNTQ